MMFIANSPSAAPATGARSRSGLNGLASLYYKAFRLSPFGFRPVFGRFAGLICGPKVRPPLGGEPLGLHSAPGPDLVVVSRGKHLRYRFSFEDRWPGILRILEQSVRKTFFCGGRLLAHDTRQK